MNPGAVGRAAEHSVNIRVIGRLSPVVCVLSPVCEAN